MHEYSIVLSLLDQVERQARQHGATAVHRVHVRIGELSGVEPDLLATAYDLARQGTLCAAATIEIAKVAAKWECRQCGREIEAGGALACRACGAPARLAAGDDIVLERLELEVSDV